MVFDLDQNGQQPQNVMQVIGDPSGYQPVRDLELLEEEVIRSGVSFIGQPAGQDAQSALIVPIAYQGQIAGLIHLKAKNPGWFDAQTLEICESLAIQAAIALGNAHRYLDQVKRREQRSTRNPHP